MKPYPAYKDSGVEWLGQVPEGWQVCLAKRAITVRSGDMVSAVDETDGGFPIIGGNGVRAYTDKTNSDADTLVIGRVGALCGCVHHIVEPFWASEHAYRVVEKKKFDRRYFFHLLTSLDLNQFAIKTAQPLLNTEIVESRWIPFPPLPEQQAIATFLDCETAKIDGLIEEQRRLIALLAEKRQATISHAVTRGLNPSARLKPSGVDWLGDIPEGWEVVRLGALFDNVAEPGSDGLPILSVSIHNGVSDEEIADEDMDRKVSRSEDRSKYIVVRPGDLTYNMMRAWQGGFGAVQVLGMVSPAYVVARPRDPSRQRTEFIELLLRTPNAVTEMKRHSRGVTDFRLRLYWDEFKTICVAMPPVAEQRTILSSISQEVGKFDALTETATSAIALLQERRAALISAAVTGKIDLRDLALVSEAA